MSDAPSAQAATLLHTVGVVGLSTDTDWPCFVGKLRPLPDAQVAIHDTPGQTPEVKWAVDYPCIQATVRGPVDGYSEAWNKGLNIKDALLGIDPFQADSETHWDGCTVLADLAFISYDVSNRPLFTINFRLIIERTPSGLSHREAL